MTLAEVKGQWDSGPGADLGILLEFPATNSIWTALTDSDNDVAQVRDRLVTIEQALREYPLEMLQAHTRLTRLRMVGPATKWGWGGATMITLSIIPAAGSMTGLVHHEMAHVFNPTPLPWPNPPGFTYGTKSSDLTGFATRYAMTALKEDIADTAKVLWMSEAKTVERASTDEILRAKVAGLVRWYSSHGLSRFDHLLVKKENVVTERIAGASRFETAVEVSRVRFPHGASAVYLVNSHDFPDALVASTLASDGPLLLVPAKGEIPEAVLNEVTRLAPDRIVAVGGPSAVPDVVLTQVLAASRP